MLGLAGGEGKVGEKDERLKVNLQRSWLGAKAVCGGSPARAGGRRRLVAVVAPLRRGEGSGAWPVRCRAVRGTRSGALLEPRRGGTVTPRSSGGVWQWWRPMLLL